MNTWMTKLWGDNTFNLCGWIFAGLMGIGGSAVFIIMGLQAGALSSSAGPLLVAIYVVLLGQFGLALQNYCARVAKTIEKKARKKKDAGAGA